MKIMVMGVGKLGSTVAFLSLFLHPKKIILKDIKPLEGDLLDLRHAAKGLNIDTKITTKTEPCNYIIITAGIPRKKEDDDLSINKDILNIVLLELNGYITSKTVIIVMTNPVKEMTEFVKCRLPDNLVTNPEKILMKMRNGKELGWDIIKTKGYSNWGPAVSCIKLIEVLEMKKYPKFCATYKVIKDRNEKDSKNNHL